MQRALHQRGDAAFACQAHRAFGGVARVVAAGDDLERRQLDAGRVGGAADQRWRTDEDRPGDARDDEMACRPQRRDVAGMDDADRRG